MTSLTTRHPGPSAAHARPVHPLAWWAWAGGAIAAITRTGSTTGIVLLTAAVMTVAATCRSRAPWTRLYHLYLGIAAAVIVLRLVFYVLFGIRTGGSVLIPLPAVPLPSWAGGVSLLGPVETQGLLHALSGALGLAAIIVCFGAANALANPKHVLRHLPGALHDLSTAVIIAVTITPQLVTSARTVRRARQLRGAPTSGVRAALGYVRPVLQEAMDRAISLAASMDSRGYASTQRAASRALTGVLLAAVLLAGVGTYGVLDTTTPWWLGAPVLSAGALIGAGATAIASRRVRRTRYRPAKWQVRETILAASGLAAAGVVTVGAQSPPASPLHWPGLPAGLIAAAVLLLVPVVWGRAPR